MFKPLHSLVTVVLDPKKDRTEGGLVIPDLAFANTRTGIVRAVGPGTAGDPLGVVPGDRVVIGVQKNRDGTAANFAGIQDDDGQEVAVMNVQDIWGIIDPVATIPPMTLTVN